MTTHRIISLLSPLLPLIASAQTHPTGAEIARWRAEAKGVTIVEDNYGVPHIYGPTDAEVVFGLLYAECEADFPRVERNYLEQLGRLSEVLGARHLAEDLEMRLIYDSASAVKDYHNSPAWLKKLCNAFADGVNYYLYKHPDVRPEVLTRFQPWFPLMFTDGSVSATSTGGLTLAEVRDFYLARSGAPMAALEAEQESATETGSNGFALAPARSAGGDALLYINPHVPFYFRFEVHLVSEEGLDAYGAVTWGQFFVYQGFNAHCGWMHTSSEADVSDAYLEKVTREGSRWTYLYAGRELPVRSKPIHLLYRQNGQMAPLDVTGYYTDHGPVLGSRSGGAGSEDAATWLSLREYNRSLAALIEAWQITKANTFDEYKAAMDLRANTTNNTVYADDQGHIAYWHGNFMPRRDPSLDWSKPVDGTTPATQWQGQHTVDQDVHVYDPPSGWIENCNSTPFTVSGPTSSPRRSDYPAYMAPDPQNYRALHAMHMLAKARQVTLDGLIRMGYDTYLGAFDTLLPWLFRAFDEAPDSLRAGLAEPVGLLRNWNRKASDTSWVTTLALEWGGLVARAAPGALSVENGSRALEGLSRPNAPLYLLEDAIRRLTDLYGNWRTPWGNINRYQRLTGKIDETYDDSKPSLPSPLASSAFGCIPSFVSRPMPGTKLRYGVSGNSFIAAVEFGKKVHAKTIETGGESSDPLSPHFQDQALGFLRGHFKEVHFYKDDVLKHAERTYHP